jgi:hypothetical protein
MAIEKESEGSKKIYNIKNHHYLENLQENITIKKID